jgi:hypothetical protein
MKRTKRGRNTNKERQNKAITKKCKQKKSKSRKKQKKERAGTNRKKRARENRTKRESKRKTEKRQNYAKMIKKYKKRQRKRQMPISLQDILYVKGYRVPITDKTYFNIIIALYAKRIKRMSSVIYAFFLRDAESIFNHITADEDVSPFILHTVSLYRGHFSQTPSQALTEKAIFLTLFMIPLILRYLPDLANVEKFISFLSRHEEYKIMGITNFSECVYVYNVIVLLCQYNLLQAKIHVIPALTLLLTKNITTLGGRPSSRVKIINDMILDAKIEKNGLMRFMYDDFDTFSYIKKV